MVSLRPGLWAAWGPLRCTRVGYSIATTPVVAQFSSRFLPEWARSQGSTCAHSPPARAGAQRSDLKSPAVRPPRIERPRAAHHPGERRRRGGLLPRRLYSALGGRHPVAVSTAVYSLATTATRNPALVLASAAMGTLFGLQRRATGGVQAPILTHLTWSTLMVHFLPPLFSAEDEPSTEKFRRRRVGHVSVVRVGVAGALGRAAGAANLPQQEARVPVQTLDGG